MEYVPENLRNLSKPAVAPAPKKESWWKRDLKQFGIGLLCCILVAGFFGLVFDHSEKSTGTSQPVYESQLPPGFKHLGIPDNWRYDLPNTRSRIYRSGDYVIRRTVIYPAEAFGNQSVGGTFSGGALQGGYSNILP